MIIAELLAELRIRGIDVGLAAAEDGSPVLRVVPDLDDVALRKALVVHHAELLELLSADGA
jgi:hypothetical protein